MICYYNLKMLVESVEVTLLSICYYMFKDIKEYSLVAKEVSEVVIAREKPSLLRKGHRH